MSVAISATILVLYYGVLLVLSLYGLHRLALVRSFRRGEPTGAPPPSDDPVRPGEWPVVTVQLPIYNERYVAERLIEAVASLDYPADRLEIQVLDDSTDDTSERVAATVSRLAARGVDVRHLRRGDRSGYKAGALAWGLERARGELVAIFDADFVPPADFLRRTVGTFRDPTVGMVQARWGHLNRDWSLLTRVQAVLLDGHFVVEHAGREAAGCFFNFNGTAGIWRRRAIEEAGGWSCDTLTEDLDLSYRAQMAGWTFRFLPEVVVPAELPAEIGAYKGQQHRWAKGSIQTARKLLATILRSPLPLRVRLEALVHLTNNSAYVLMVLLSLLVYPAQRLRWDDQSWPWLLVDLGVFLVATGSVLWFYATSQRALGRPGWRFGSTVGLMGLGIGLALHNGRAVLEGLWQRGGEFRRTPKFSLEGTEGSWVGKAYGERRPWSFWGECLFATYLAVCTALALHQGMWPCLPFLVLFLYGHVAMVLLGLGMGRSGSRRAGEIATLPESGSMA